MIDLARLLARVPAEAADAVVGMARLRSASLNAHLRRTFGAVAGADGSILSEPYLEGAFPWLPAPDGWAGVPAGLMHPRTLEILQQVGRPPYAHQVTAWSHLCAEDPRSVIVSSGTGSGKTECFLAPILDRLIRASDGGTRTLEGVRAIMLYPLNALINSQEERLSEWFRPLDGRLRYALYNGELPDDAPTARGESKPWKVDNRRGLRLSPPPVLVTNITMLEYMLIRQKDAPILRRSQGTLDFIVLDEAHSYVGAQAAEIALLLRRVALAFGKRPDQLRYVATSATIGDGAEEPLRTFLRGLSGAPDDQIHVVTGSRARLPPASQPRVERIDLGRLAAANPNVASVDLASNPALRVAREALRNGGIMSWRNWRGVCESVLGDQASDGEAVELLVRSAAARDPLAPPMMAASGADSVLPVRVHLFHGTLSGLWACVDPACPGRPDVTDANDWPFGAVYPEPRARCVHCESLVLEWVFCSQCGDGALKAEEIDDATRLGAWSALRDEDEFDQKILQDETFGREEEDGAEPVVTAGRRQAHRRYLVRHARGHAARVKIDPRSGRYLDGAGAGLDLLAIDDIANCPACGGAPHRVDPTRGALRPLAAGSPFLMSQIAPGLLAHLSARTDVDQDAPLQGRQLITFTDARQGTARHAANIQIASERGFIRGFLYHTMQDGPRPPQAEMDEVEARIAALRGPAAGDPVFKGMLNDAEARRTALLGGPAPRPWREVVRSLATTSTLDHHLRDIWRERDPAFDDPGVLAEFLLYREIMRRPVRYTNAETLGLVRFVLPGVDDVARPLPRAATDLGLTEADWRDLLRLLLTHFVRTNVALDFDRDTWMPWIDRRQIPTQVTVRRPDSVSQRYVRFWPGATPTRPTRVVRMVAQALGLALDDPAARDRLDELMAAAWSAFQTFTTAGDPGNIRFCLDRFALAPVMSAWACPVTRRIVDTCFRGLSPYDEQGRHSQATAVQLPRLAYPFLMDGERRPVAREAMDAWLAEDPQVVALRTAGLWGDQQDRAARFTPWIRAAEHSAQQPGYVLRRYETEFKQGAINVLGCSTTMEMGVDIGSIEAVLNTNAPPAIANYRQRVGRAGRQRQPISVGLTLCKDRPLDRAAFSNPQAYLETVVRAPSVSLDSPTIARRQANAYLLARFLAAQGEELHKLTNGHFFGLGRAADAAGLTPVQAFLAWLDAAPGDQDLMSGLSVLLAGTPLLSGVVPGPEMDLWAVAREQMEAIEDELRAEWEALYNRERVGRDQDRSAGRRARDFQRERLEKGYLLSELAGRGFLPSYGFPTDVVQFATDTRAERNRRTAEDEDRLSSRGYPSRSRDLAIFEYAPGRGIVVDGVVRESAGVTLNWKRPATEPEVREVQNLRLVNACEHCGALWSAPSAATQKACPECDRTGPKFVRYLSPGGFAVAQDFKPHDDPSNLGAPLPVDPWVSARSGVWRALPDPSVGRLRTSATGLVFWFNPGPHGHGFGICLHCGRAEVETTAEGGEILLGHEPLRGWPRVAGGLCSGAPEVTPFAVQRRLKLGHEIQTDVAELQLFDCASREAALAIALALREAIARRLGVDADEMGFAAPPARLPDEAGQCWSAVVFDRASGGAGFASTLADDPVGLLREAREQLNCGRPGRCGDLEAVAVCPLCVLAADSQHAAEDTDRRAAFGLLTEVERRLTLPAEHRLFGAATEYESAPLPDALSARLQAQSDAALYLALPAGADRWDLEAWPMSAVVNRWGARGRAMMVSVDPADLEAADPVTRRRLALWAQRGGATLAARSVVMEPPLLAAIVRPGGSTGWSSSDPAAAAIGATWAAVSGAPVVRGAIAPPMSGEEIVLEDLLRHRPREAVLEIAGELDGAVTGFGVRFRTELLGRNPDFAPLFAEPCLSLEYEDSYLFNPLSVRLVIELLRPFTAPTTELRIRTLAARRGGDARLGQRIDQDWRTLADRDQVLGALMTELTPRAALDLADRTTHRRRLRFRTARGSGTIYFDQGVGAWRAADALPFDFTIAPAAQLASIKLAFEVASPFGTYVALKLDDVGPMGPA